MSTTEHRHPFTFHWSTTNCLLKVKRDCTVLHSISTITMGRGKKGKKVDLEKKAALQARKEAKGDKAARKRLAKETRTGGVDGPDDDAAAFEALLQQYNQQSSSSPSSDHKNSPYLEPLDSFPLARANATFTLNEDAKKKNAEVFLFGGEYFDGVEQVVLDHLLLYNVQRNEWKRIHSPAPTPPPRCAHSCVYYNHALYIFGGETAAADQYHHYKDIWRYDIKAMTWQEIKPPKAMGTHPTSRSGHTAVVWKHFMIIFGGFMEAMKDTSPRWHNDVVVLDLQTHTWLEVPHSKLAARPEPRSACNAAIIDDSLIIHGGFSKLMKGNSLARSHGSRPQQQQSDDQAEESITAETKVHNDTWVLRLKPLLASKPPTWERLTSSVQRTSLDFQRSPNGRAGTTSIAYKDRLLVFGGVIDAENFHHKLNSKFYNTLFCFDSTKRKWFPVHVKTSTAGDGKKRRRRKNQNENNDDGGDDPNSSVVSPSNDSDGDDDDNDEVDLIEEDDENEHLKNQEDAGWDLDRLRSNMFAFIDGDGNIVYEKIEDSDAEQEREEEKEVKKSDSESEGENQPKDKDVVNSSTKHSTTSSPTTATTKSAKPQSTSRTNATSAAGQIVSSSSVMVLNPETQKPEAVERTEPLPRINCELAIVGNALYIYGGLLEVGDREITLDDCWVLDLKKRDGWKCLYQGSMHRQVWRGAVHDDDDSYYSSNEKALEDQDLDDDDDDEEEKVEELQSTDGKKKNKKSEIKAQMNGIIEEYKMQDDSDTPHPGESLADFYQRTGDYWNKRASSDGVNISKDDKREGFSLCQERFEFLGPAMKELKALDKQYREEKKKGKVNDGKV